jgi:hypothetical protein
MFDEDAVLDGAGDGAGDGTGDGSFDVVVGEVAGLTDAQLVDEFRAIERSLRWGEARLAVVLAEAERRAVFACDGHASMRGWLKATARWSNAECQRRLQLARLVAADAQVGACLHDGEVGVAQVHELARAHANPRCGGELVGETARTLLGHASKLSFEDFRVVVRRWEMLADVDGAHRDHEAAVKHRSASVVEFDGVLHVRGRGGAVHAASMVEIFRRFCDAEFAADVEWVRDRFGASASKELMPRTDAQRRFDALEAIFAAAVVALLDGQPPEPVVNIVIDQVTWETHLARRRLIPWPADLAEVPIADRRCETTDGVLLDPDDVVAAAFAGHVRRVVFDAAGVVTDMGRRRRLFTGAAREAVRLQSSRCVWPGCDIASGQCQSDHNNGWVADAGPTRPDNGAPMCGRHNRWKNRGYRTRRDDDGHWHTYRPDGTEID